MNLNFIRQLRTQQAININPHKVFYLVERGIPSVCSKSLFIFLCRFLSDSSAPLAAVYSISLYCSLHLCIDTRQSRRSSLDLKSIIRWTDIPSIPTNISPVFLQTLLHLSRDFPIVSRSLKMKMCH